MTGPDIIDLAAERGKREAPDPEFVRTDNSGRKLLAFALDYRMGESVWGVRIWAYSFEDAEARVAAMRESLILAGQVYGEIPL